MKKNDDTTQLTKPDYLGENTSLILKVDWKTIHDAYISLLRKESSKVNIPGFRRGKAPAPLAEAAIGKQRLLEHALQHILPNIYNNEIKKTGIIPLVAPQIVPKETDEEKEWVFEALTAVAPQVDLSNYEEIITKTKKNFQSAHTVDKKIKEVDPEKQKEELTQAIYTALIETFAPKIAPLLLEEEMKRQANQLLTQLDRLHMSFDEYLQKLKKSREQFESELGALSLSALQLEFILREIATKRHIVITDTDIRSSFPELKDKKELTLPPDLRSQIEAVILRRKTSEELLKIATDTA